MEPDPPTSAHFIAFSGLSCYNCNKTVEDLPSEGGLLRCGGCRRLWYCSSECQKRDWQPHKALCKALQSLEQDPAAMNELIKSFAEASQRDTVTAISDSTVVAHKQRMVNLNEKVLGRPLNNREWDIIVCEPRCFACARTDIVLRAEAAMSEESESQASGLTSCPSCKMAFFCCEDHWDIVQPVHQEPCEALPGGVSQCEMNRQSYADAAFRTVLTASDAQPLMWRFIPRQPGWISLKDRDWETTIGSDVMRAAEETVVGAGNSNACIRLVSSLGSTVMTILYALEQLSDSTAWTTKPMLTIHMIGSPADFFPNVAYMYEAILHRLPRVQKINLFTFVPPLEGGPGAPSMLWTLDTCGHCSPRGGKIINHFTTKNYEAFIHNEAELFMPPDICVATNSSKIAENGACPVAPDHQIAYRTTHPRYIHCKLSGFLKKFRTLTISVLQARDRGSAERDEAILRECGAKLVPSLTLVKNPFGDLVMTHLNFNRVHGYHASNAWLAGAFH
ncbi:hypothetical protein FB451DRAFT_1403543 [Mycena latifolia]|nr:hypothetical protein FB451DRAFT_1403543 [Mycena latifolia]